MCYLQMFAQNSSSGSSKIFFTSNIMHCVSPQLLFTCFLCWYSVVGVHILLHYAMNFLKSFKWGKILCFLGARSFPGHIPVRVLWTLALKGRAGGHCSRCQHPNLKVIFSTFHSNFQPDRKPCSSRTPLPFLVLLSHSLLCTFRNLKVFLPLSLSLPTSHQTQFLLSYLCISPPAHLHCWPCIWTLLFYSPQTSLAPLLL